jgi:hypothetical protein
MKNNDATEIACSEKMNHYERCEREYNKRILFLTASASSPTASLSKLARSSLTSLLGGG